jgi:acylphosphatase
VQKEIEAHGLVGNVLDADEGKLVVVVEGEETRINGMYNALKNASPNNVVFTLVEYGAKPKEKISKEEEKWGEVVELLREIEKTMRKMNNKLDILSSGRIESLSVAEQPKEEGGEKKDAESAFAFMFG